MKYALIGCGRIAVNHIKAALNNKLEIVAVCDVLPEKMEALLAKYELQDDQTIKRYTDYKKTVSYTHLDVYKRKAQGDVLLRESIVPASAA